MPRYTPLYRLPALEPSTPVRQLADVDWANAQAIEAILANQGQPPLGSDLTSLIKRLNALEAARPGLWHGNATKVDLPSGAVTTMTPLARQADSIRDDGFIVSNTNGVVTVREGIYVVSTNTVYSVRTASRTFTNISFDGVEVQRSPGAAEDQIAGTVPLAVPAGTTRTVQFAAFQAMGSGMQVTRCDLQIMKVG